MDAEVLKERYELLCATESDMFEHLPTFVQAVKALHATKVIELGTRWGVSTIAWLYALQGQGQLWSVDCSFPTEDPLTEIELLNPQGPLGVVPHWLFLLGYDTWDIVKEALPWNVDIVFIDTNHVYEETLDELEIYRHRVKPGGRIYLHDTALEETGNATTPQPPWPVRTAMEEFCKKYKLAWTNVENCYGLGTIYV